MEHTGRWCVITAAMSPVDGKLYMRKREGEGSCKEEEWSGRLSEEVTSRDEKEQGESNGEGLQMFTATCRASGQG